MSEEVKPHDISQEIWMEALELQRNLTGNRADCISLREFDDNTVTLARALVSARASSQAEIARLREALQYARKGLDMIHNGLMDPTRPRQAVGEVCAHFLGHARSALSETRSDG